MENTVNGDAAFRSKLLEKLRLIENLWQQLAHSRWDQGVFIRFQQLIRDTVGLTRQHGEESFVRLAEQLDRHVMICAAARSVSQEQGQIVGLISRLRRSLTETGTDTGFEKTRTRRMGKTTQEIMVVSRSDTRQLIAKLQDSGFQTRTFSNLAEAERVLEFVTPMVLIVDLDLPGRPLGGTELVMSMRTNNGASVPVYFIAERDDITARLEAVQAGGEGFFQQPLEVVRIVEKVQNRLLTKSSQSVFRVLIIDDHVAEAQKLARAVVGQEIAVELVTEPVKTLQMMGWFRPDMVVLDLDLETMSGVELYRVMRQHRACEGLPMTLLSNRADLNHRLSQLAGDNDDLLSKPVSADYLAWFVVRRLRQTQSIRTRLISLSQKDPVSGLYNRRYFLALLERLFNRGGVQLGELAVMLVMLDNMRAIREALDPVAVDEVIGMAARRLRKVVDARAQPARFGDAMFALTVEGASREELLKQSQAILKGLEGSVYRVEKQEVRLKLCIGISINEKDEKDPLEMIQRADLSCSLAREKDQQRIHIHDLVADREIGEPVQQRLQDEVREAVEKGRLALLFQPVVSLKGEQDERYEVLLRMYNREGRELLPESVFSMIQQTRLGMGLDRWVINQCIRLLRERRHRVPPTTLFINISAATLHDTGLLAWMKERLAKAEVSGEYLAFELGEATARKYLTESRDFLENVHQLGCKFGLQRFGRRQESLDLLRELPADYVKPYIDFVHDLVNNKARQERMQNLVASLGELGVTPIISGVEDLHTLPILWSYGVNYVQGFFLQRPEEHMNYDFAGNAF